MFTFAYPAVFRRDEDGRSLVSFPDFPTARTDGANPNEALKEAIDCLGSSIAFAMADKAPVPKPSVLKRGQKSVPATVDCDETRSLLGDPGAWDEPIGTGTPSEGA
jgi:predicted RNase H-like HicB family nuclease